MTTNTADRYVRDITETNRAAHRSRTPHDRSSKYVSKAELIGRAILEVPPNSST